MQDIGYLINSACALLNITIPVEVILKTKMAGNEEGYAGYCEYNTRRGRIIKFKLIIVIPVCVVSGYSMADVILHEICHAAQIQHGIFDSGKHHDEKFQALCSILENELPKVGFTVGKLYNPATDTD